MSSASHEIEQLQAGIAALESQRAMLGDSVVELALAPLRAKLAALSADARAAAPPDQSLRQVSVLFLDVVGSTAIGRQLDPEDIHAVIDGALERCTAIVGAHRGKVLQYAGDSLLAVFGADEAREDDAERAVRCGLELLAEARAQREQVRQRFGHGDFDLRVGIHTGSVLLGGGVDAAHSIRGAAVNVAARMEQSAPPGGLRISHDTYRHVRGVFDVEPQPPLAVKGLDQPIATYLVQRAKPRAFRVATRGIEGVETCMVGRDAELERLQDALERVCRERRLVGVSVVAEAGLGKSRLLYEFENWAEARPETFYLFRGRAHPQTPSQPYGLLRDVIARRLQIVDTDSMSLARQKVEQGIVPLFEHDDGTELAQAHADLLGHLIGFDFTDSKHVRGIQGDARQLRNRGFHAAAQWLRRVGALADGAVVLLLDDLHYADDESLDFLRYLCEVDRDVPLLLLGATRPALFERRADGVRRGEQRIELAPLDKGASGMLCNELLKKLERVPAALRELIAGSAEGNPFYMEELVKMLIDEGAIRTGAERWSVVPDRLVAARVPQTLTGVLQARLDGLSPAERLALQQASVIGFVFWDEGLAAIDAAAPAALPALIRRELVIAHPDTGLEGTREYAFKHQLLHQVAYGTVLKRLRRECHARVAAWLAGQSGARANNTLAATAEHYEQAGDREQACEFFTRAAEHARQRHAHEAALHYVANALALDDGGDAALAAQGGADAAVLVAQDDAGAAAFAAQDDARMQRRWRLLDVRERTLEQQGKRDEQRAAIETLQQLADALGDDGRRGEVAWRRSTLAMRTADYHTQQRMARQAIALAARAGNEKLELRAQHTLALALTYLGAAAAGRSMALQGLAAARALGLRAIESRFLNALAIVASFREDTPEAVELGRLQVPIDRELGNVRDEAITLGNLGTSLMGLGDRIEARQCLDEGLRLARAVGDRDAELVPLVMLSQLALREGRDTAALAHAQAALELAVAVENPPLQLLASCALGDAELALGRHAAAAAAFERAHAVGLAIGSPMRFDASAGLVRTALACGDAAQAMRSADAVLGHIAGGGSLESTDSPRLIELSCYRALACAGDPRAAGLLAGAHAALQAKAATFADPGLRERYLNEVPEHREIVAAWAATQSIHSGANA